MLKTHNQLGIWLSIVTILSFSTSAFSSDASYWRRWHTQYLPAIYMGNLGTSDEIAHNFLFLRKF